MSTRENRRTHPSRRYLTKACRQRKRARWTRRRSVPYVPAPVDEEDVWYLQRFQMGAQLTTEQEQETLARMMQGDDEAREVLVCAYLPLVARLSRTYQGKGVPLADLLQEGALGLLHAMKTFHPTGRFPFHVFVRRRILWAMNAAVREQACWTTLPPSLQQQLERVALISWHLSSCVEHEVFDEEVMRIAGLTGEQIAVLQSACVPPLSLELSRASQDEGGEWRDTSDTLKDHLADPFVFEDDLLEQERERNVRAAVASLTMRERMVLALRFGLWGMPQENLHRIGQRLQVSKERIRQIELRALRKLRYPPLAKAYREA